MAQIHIRYLSRHSSNKDFSVRSSCDREECDSKIETQIPETSVPRPAADKKENESEHETGRLLHRC